MRVLDVDLKDALDNMNRNDLDRLLDLNGVIRALEKATPSVQHEEYKRLVNAEGAEAIDSKILQDCIGAVAGSDIARIINDDSAINEIPDEIERWAANTSREPSSPGEPPSPARHIDKKSIVSLIRRTQLMRQGEGFAKQFTSMSSQEIHNLLSYDESLKLHDSTKYSIDPAYGISNLDKRNILRVMQTQAYTRELVSQIPPKEFQKIKNRFENLRNGGNGDIKFMTKEVFGQEIDLQSKGMDRMQMIDLAEAFNEREKEQAHKSQNNIFAKIKNLFNRFRSGKKALPEGKNNLPKEKMQNGHNSYVSSLAPGNFSQNNYLGNNQDVKEPPTTKGKEEDNSR